MSLSYASRRIATAAILLAVCAVGLYLPFLSASLDDFDSFNFARALARFDPAHFQPHPPGYVLYVLAGQLALALAGDARLALTALSALGAAVAIGVFFAAAALLFNSRTALIAVWLAIATPLMGLNAGKALSDSPALLVQSACCLLIALACRRRAPLWAAGLGIGLALGFRPQAVLGLAAMLFVAGVWLRLPARRWAGVAVALAVGAGAWVLPTLAAFDWNVGAFVGYLQGAAGFVAGQESLFAAAVSSEAIAGRWRAVWDWSSQAVFGSLPEWLRAALMLGALGLVVLAVLRRPPIGVWLCTAWLLPQLVLHLLFLNPELTRYGLVLLLPMAMLIARGLVRLPMPGQAADLATRRERGGRAAAWQRLVARVGGLAVALAFAALAGASSLRLAQQLHTTPAPPDQLAAYLASHYAAQETLVIARQSYNALSYHLPGWDVRFADAYDPVVLARDLDASAAQYIVIADPESLQPGDAYVEIDTLAFSREPQVHAKHATVTASVYGRASALGARDFALPDDGAIRIGTPQDGKYVLDGWYRRELVGGELARWTGGADEALLRMVLPPGAHRLSARVLAFPDGQSVEFQCDGRAAGHADVPTVWTVVTATLPADCTHAGRPSLFTLRFALRRAPSEDGRSTDRRLLAIAVSEIVVK